MLACLIEEKISHSTKESCHRELMVVMVGVCADTLTRKQKGKKAKSQKRKDAICLKWQVIGADRRCVCIVREWISGKILSSWSGFGPAGTLRLGTSALAITSLHAPGIEVGHIFSVPFAPTQVK